MIGSRLGSYEILDEIGRGGMGRVYRARQPALDRIVAVKVLLPQLAADEIFVQRFLREARSIATLEHPGIVTIHDVGEADGTYYFAMQLLDGQPLDDVLEQHARMTTEAAVKVVRQVAQALGYAHDNGILHRDVKPGNIILTHAGQAVLTDFGIAQALSDTRLTKTGTSIGSPEYMAPEQIEGKSLDARADLYSLGIVFYQTLTGELPYQGESAVAIVYQHVKAPVPSARQVDPEIPEQLDQVVAKLMAKRPDERFDTAQSLVAALDGEPVESIAPLAEASAAPWGKRLSIAALLLGVVLIAVYFFQGGATELRELLPVPADELETAPEAAAEPASGSDVEGESAELIVPAAEPTDPLPAAPVAETFEITSQPPGATVVLNEETLAAKTPATIELLPETAYRLRVRLDGHEPQAWNFTLTDLSESQRSSKLLHFPLPSSTPPGVISFDADYPVEVEIDGRTYSGDRVELEPGSYEATISAPSVYFSETRRLTLTSGETQSIPLPMTTSIRISANPSNCRVKIDGRDAGYLPADVRLTVGDHVFEFEWETLGKSRRLGRTITAQTERVFGKPAP